MSFHELLAKSEERFAQVVSNPAMADLHQLAKDIQKHYAGPEVTRSNFTYVHAAMCIFLTADIRAAEQMVMKDLMANYSAAHRAVLNCINEGPESLQAQKDWLYAKGFMFCWDKYFQAPKGLEKGSDFDITRRKISPALQPIMDHALLFAVSKSRKDEAAIFVGPKILTYVAVQLMPEGLEKKARLNALCIQHGNNPYQNDLSRSYDVITELAKRKQIVIPEGLVAKGAASLTASQQLEAKRAERVASFDAAVAPAISVSDATKGPRSLSPVALPEKAERPVTTLRDQLMTLIKQKVITQNEALIFNWLQGGGDILRTPKSAAEHFNRPLTVITLINIRVSRILATLEPTEGNVAKPAAPALRADHN